VALPESFKLLSAQSENSEMGWPVPESSCLQISVEARECAATIGLGFTLPANSQESVMDKSGQVFGAEELEAVSF
jgi:hypothetical protein